jgi:broad specificity phosphatase PhoE
MKLIFVRHGQTTWNAEDRIQGQLDPELSQLGLRQAAAVAEALAMEKADAVYSSDLQRAHVTAAMIADRLSQPVITTPVLREVNLGVWQGMSISEIQEKYPEDYAAYRQDSIRNRPAMAERIESVIDRTRHFIEMVMREHPTGNVIAVAHGGVIRGALCCALNTGPELYRRVRLENAGITALALQSSGRSHLHSMNETCHLKLLDEQAALEEV